MSGLVLIFLIIHLLFLLLWRYFHFYLKREIFVISSYQIINNLQYLCWEIVSGNKTESCFHLVITDVYSQWLQVVVSPSIYEIWVPAGPVINHKYEAHWLIISPTPCIAPSTYGIYDSLYHMHIFTIYVFYIQSKMFICQLKSTETQLLQTLRSISGSICNSLITLTVVCRVIMRA